MSGPIALAVLGDPLAFTLSPVLHRAALAGAGLEGSSAAIRTSVADLGARFEALSAEGFRGANLTSPLKQAALAHVNRVSEAARLSRSVNTVGFGADGTWGDTTDGPGFVDLLWTLGRDPAGQRVVLLGGGGAARSLALALAAAGARVTGVVRRPADAATSWSGIGEAALAAWGGPDCEEGLASATVVVNATTLADPFPVAGLPAAALVVDLHYGAALSGWARAARALGREAYDGLGLLVFQARRSAALWLGQAVDVDVLARAVGWPR